MKKCLFFLFLLAIGGHMSAQTISNDDVIGLAPAMQTENWEKAFARSSELLKAFPNDTSDFRAMTAYVNIRSAAGMRTRGQLSAKELEKTVNKYRGQRLIVSAHPVTENPNSFLEIKFTSAENTTEASITAANSRGTTILSFEKFIFSSKPDVDALPDRAIIRCGGILDKIELNKDKSMVWVLRLTFKDAFIRL